MTNEGQGPDPSLTSESTPATDMDIAILLGRMPPGTAISLLRWTVAPSVSPATSGAALVVVTLPRIQLHCPECDGVRWFGPISHLGQTVGECLLDFPWFGIASYRCQNCNKSHKTFALGCTPPPKYHAWKSQSGNRLEVHARPHDAAKEDLSLRIWKIGEWPQYGQKPPARVERLLQKDRKLFLLGYRAEQEGFGLGAAAYYRRVVERQKDRIFDRMIKVASVLPGHDDLVAELTEAKGQTQFANAIASIKSAIPEILRINGHSPLQLLHQAISADLHDGTDEEFLANATDFRLVLVDLVERMDLAIRDDGELKAAVHRLTSKPRQRRTSGEVPQDVDGDSFANEPGPDHTDTENSTQ